MNKTIICEIFKTQIIMNFHNNPFLGARDFSQKSVFISEWHCYSHMTPSSDFAANHVSPVSSC